MSRVRNASGIDSVGQQAPDAAEIHDKIVVLKQAAAKLNWDRQRNSLDAEIDAIQLDDFERYPTLRYGPPGEDFVIDVITRLGTAFRYEDLEAETLTLEGVRVRVATPATLVRMKAKTLRPIDCADAEALRRMFRLEEP